MTSLVMGGGDMSDTPRTDAAEFYSPHSSQKFCDAEFTRILERHLNEANDLIIRLQATINRLEEAQ